MSEETREERARRRAKLIVRVQSGLMTATEAARELGVSRKTCYEWEQRALAAMAQALEDRPGGRPAKPTDSEKESLSEQNRRLQEQLKVCEATLAIREALARLEAENVKKKP
jgi:transposase